MASTGPNEPHSQHDQVVSFSAIPGDDHVIPNVASDLVVLASRHAWLEDTKSPVSTTDGSKPPGHESDSECLDVQLPDEGHFSVLTHWRGELMTMLKLALPCIVANTSTQIMVITDQIFVGHIGVNEFAAAALANTWFNLLWSFMLGASTAMDTLASQAYGNKDYRSLLVWTYSGLIINTLFCFPLMGALLVGEHAAAVLFHQGYGPVATLVSDFCKALIPGLWPLIWSMILMKFLQTQNSMAMPAIIAGLACAINVGINFWLVGSFGFVGSPWATTACRIVQALLTLAACIYQQHKAIKRAGLTWRDWTPMSRVALKTACHPSILWEHGKLALAGGVMNAFEATAFDVTTAFAGALGVTATAAHAALLSICNFCFNALPFAISIAATIRCANLLGAGRPKQARLAGILSMVLGVAFQGATGVVLGASQGQVVRIFTSDPDVLASVKTIAWLAMMFQFSDGLFGTVQGVLRAMGGQVGCIVYNFVGFWGGGVVVGWFLTFKVDMGLTGLWIGLLTGNAFATFLSMIALSRCNWRAAAIKLFTEVQQAALVCAAEGDLTDQLAADEARGLITHVDMSDFSKEMQFFVVPPGGEEHAALSSPGGDALATRQSVAAVLTGLKHRGSVSFSAAPGLFIPTRGGSVTAAVLANARMISISAVLHSPRAQLQQEHHGGWRPVSQGITPMAGGIAFHEEGRQSDCVRLMRPFAVHINNSVTERQSDRCSQDHRSSRALSNLTTPGLMYQPSVSHLAAALSRGGVVQPIAGQGQGPLTLRRSINRVAAALEPSPNVQHAMSSVSSSAGFKAAALRPLPGLIIMPAGSSKAQQLAHTAEAQAGSSSALKPAQGPSGAGAATRLGAPGQGRVQSQAVPFKSPVSPGVQGGWSKG